MYPASPPGRDPPKLLQTPILKLHDDWTFMIAPGIPAARRSFRKFALILP